MAHSAAAVMVIVAFGLGAFLYYMFANNTNNDEQHRHSNEGHPLPEPPDSWTTSPDGRPRRRKRGSSVTSGGRAKCTICLTELPDKDYLQLFPCKHEFHKECMCAWREQGPSETRNTCPNCRDTIFGSAIL